MTLSEQFLLMLTFCGSASKLLAMEKTFQLHGNAEFVRTRSFEIAWAIFRCADLIKQDKLKRELENSAIDLAIKYHDFGLGGRGDTANIHKLITLIKLAEVGGVMNLINARVLERELKNLIKVADDLKENQKPEEKEPLNIEKMFSKSGKMLGARRDIQTRRQNPFGADRPKFGGREENNNPIHRIAEEESDLAMEQHSSPNGNSNTIADSAIMPSGFAEKLSIRQAIKPFAEQVNSAIDSSKTAQVEISSADLLSESVKSLNNWQKVIFGKVKEIGHSTTRDLTVFFPQISERTLRFYLQRLCESGLLERVGKGTGPGGYYKVTSN